MHYNLRLGTFLILVLGGVYCAFSTDNYNRLYAFFHFHHIEVSGNSLLSDTDVLASLPVERDNLWWYQNRVPISLGLSKHPLIKNASVEPCSPARFNLKHFATIIETWGCFKVVITERSPAFRVSLGPRQWLVDDAGAVLAMIPNRSRSIEGGGALAQAASQEGTPESPFSRLPLLEGAISDLTSPDEANARIRYLIARTRQLSSATEMQVAGIKFLDRGEMLVHFQSLPFAVRFGSELHTVPGDFTKIALDEQVQRLQALAPRVRGDSAIREIDLGFNRLAVVHRK
jgi:hypothetical protein